MKAIAAMTVNYKFNLKDIMWKLSMRLFAITTILAVHSHILSVAMNDTESSCKHSTTHSDIFQYCERNDDNQYCYHRSSYRNPMLGNFSSKDLTISKHNRCNLYPRCLLFHCCPDALLDYTMEFFVNSSISKQGTAMDDAAPDYQLPSHRPASLFLHERISKMAIFNVTLTTQLLTAQLAALPPTNSQTFIQNDFDGEWKLNHSKRLDPNHHLRVLYLVQGDDKLNLPAWYSNFTDMIFLSYTNQYEGCLYYPNSTYGLGRTALYLAARLLELEQCWLYDYYVFLDDDAVLMQGTVAEWELILKVWQPAVAVPLLVSRNYRHTKVIDSLSLIDYIFVAYHREVVEIIHPFVQEYDEECTIASQVIQSLEISLAYRGHQLVISHLQLSNEQHRYYPLDCDAAIDKLFHFHKETTPPLLKHCVFDYLTQFYQQFSLGSVVASPLPKITHYHIEIGNINGQGPYPLKPQLACESAAVVDGHHHLPYWDPWDSLCCSLDNIQIHSQFETELLKRKSSLDVSGNYQYQSSSSWRPDFREQYPRHNTIQAAYDEESNLTHYFLVWGNMFVFVDKY